MRINAIWGLTVVLVASTFVGCGQSRSVVRGQSPAGIEAAQNMDGPIIGTAPGYAEQTHANWRRATHHDFRTHNGIRDNNFGYEGGYYAGPQGYYADRGRMYTANGHSGSAGQSGCPACEYGNACPQGGCQHCGYGCNNGCPGGNCGPGGCPQHYQTYQYNWPQNMVYPPDQVPAGIVQYPYYTLRGPTDFFMK